MVGDDQLAASAAPVLHGHLGAEALGQFAFERGDVGIGFLGGLRFVLGRHPTLRQLLAPTLHLAHRQALFRRGVRQCDRGGRRQGQQRARMAHFQSLVLEQFADVGRQFEQAQQVRYRRARTAYGFGGLLVGQRKFVDQSRQRLRFFQRIEVFALDVLDQRHRDDGAVVDLAHDHGHIGQAGELRGAPAAFAGDDLVFVPAGFAHDDGLDHALRLDRLGQFGQPLRIHAGARLVTARMQQADLQRAHAVAAHVLGGGRRRLAGAEQGFEPTPQAAFLGRHHAVSLCFFSRRITSPARPR